MRTIISIWSSGSSDNQSTSFSYTKYRIFFIVDTWCQHIEYYMISSVDNLITVGWHQLCGNPTTPTVHWLTISTYFGNQLCKSMVVAKQFHNFTHFLWNKVNCVSTVEFFYKEIKYKLTVVQVFIRVIYWLVGS